VIRGHDARQQVFDALGIDAHEKDMCPLFLARRRTAQDVDVPA